MISSFSARLAPQQASLEPNGVPKKEAITGAADQIFRDFLSKKYIPQATKEELSKIRDQINQENNKTLSDLQELYRNGTQILRCLNGRERAFMPYFGLSKAVIAYKEEVAIFYNFRSLKTDEDRRKCLETERSVIVGAQIFEDRLSSCIENTEKLRKRMESEIRLGFSEEEVRQLQDILADSSK